MINTSKPCGCIYIYIYIHGNLVNKVKANNTVALACDICQTKQIN